MAFLPLVFVVISPILAVFFAITLSKPQEAYVGSEYEKEYDKQKGTLPRVLFLSSDPGGGEIQILKPVLWKQQDVMKKKNVTPKVTKVCQKTRHWYHTHHLAWIFLKKFNPNLQFKDICPYFAHTNSAKCCEDNKKSSQSAARFFENCRGYIPGEIQILDPDILITQGDFAKWAIEVWIFSIYYAY